MSTQQHEVAIIGGGIIGLLQSILLKEAGVDVAIYERQSSAYHLPRAATLDHETLRLFFAAGMRAEIMPLLDTSIAADFVWRDADMNPLAHVAWGAKTITGLPRVSAFHQPSMEKTLEVHCNKMKIPIVRQKELIHIVQDKDGVDLTFRPFINFQGVEDAPRTTVRAQYVIGCDGANSTVRRMMGLEEHLIPFSFDFLIVDLKITKPEPPEVLKYVPSQVCDPKRPTTIVFGGPGRRRFEFQRHEHESKEEMTKPETVQSLINGWGYNNDNCEVERAVVYTFMAKWAKNWQKDRVFLSGDSCHLTPPFLGQGMNSGARDAANLCWRLAAVLRNGASTKVLDSYTAERLPHVSYLIELAIELGKVICETDEEKAAANCRELREKGVDNEKLLTVGRPGLLYTNKAEYEGSLGMQSTIRLNGKEALADEVLGRGWTILYSSPDEIDPLSDTSKAFWKSLSGITANVGIERVDVEGNYAEWFKKLGDAKAVLFRPDFYVYGYVNNLSEIDSMVSKLESQLSGQA